MRMTSFIVLLLASSALNAAHAEVSADCKTFDRTKTVAACSSEIDKPGIGKADRLSAYVYRAQAYKEDGRYKEALDDLRKAQALNDRVAGVYGIRGEVLWRMGQNDKALVELNTALSINKSYQWAYWQRGVVYVALSNWAAAKADLDQAILLDPAHSSSYAVRGRMYRLSGEIDKALEDLDTSIRMSPKYTYALNQRGETRLLKRDLRGALADFDAVLAILPNDATAQKGRAAAAAQLGGTPSASNAPNGQQTQAAGKPPQQGAGPQATPVKPEQPGERQTLLAGARKAMDRSDFKTVYQLTTRYLELDKTNAEVFLLRGDATNRFAVSVGNSKLYAEALRDLDDAIKLAPNLYLALIQRGYVHGNMNNATRGKDDADRAVQLSPENAQGYALRCFIQRRLGRYEDGVSDCDRAIVLSPSQAAYYVGRARLNLARKQYASVETDLDTALRYSPRYSDALFYKGTLFLATGRTKDADAAFNQALGINANSTGAQRGKQSILAVRALGLITKPKGGDPKLPEVTATPAPAPVPAKATPPETPAPQSTSGAPSPAAPPAQVKTATPNTAAPPAKPAVPTPDTQPRKKPDKTNERPTGDEIESAEN